MVQHKFMITLAPPEGAKYRNNIAITVHHLKSTFHSSRALVLFVVVFFSQIPFRLSFLTAQEMQPSKILQVLGQNTYIERYEFCHPLTSDSQICLLKPHRSVQLILSENKPFCRCKSEYRFSMGCSNFSFPRLYQNLKQTLSDSLGNPLT